MTLEEKIKSLRSELSGLKKSIQEEKIEKKKKKKKEADRLQKIKDSKKIESWTGSNNKSFQIVAGWWNDVITTKGLRRRNCSPTVVHKVAGSVSFSKYERNRIVKKIQSRPHIINLR